MYDYIVTTDSTVDLSQERMQQLGVPYAQLYYHMDGESRPDDMTDETARFIYASMLQGKVITTSQPTPEDFMALWRPIFQAGQDVLHIGFSSALSGSVNSARLAQGIAQEEFPQRRVCIVDSLCASGGEGMLLQHTLRKREEGLDLDACYAWAEANKLRVHHWYTVDDLIYLRRGGRVSGAAAFVAGLLHIKPVMNMDLQGRLIPREKVKGRRASIKRMAEKLSQFINLEENPFIHITHADCLADALALKAMIQEKFPSITQVDISYVGAVIGAHAGPGTLALFFMGDGRE